MSAGAIAMLVVAVCILWGGLTVAIVRLRKHPDELSPSAGAPRGEGGDAAPESQGPPQR